MFSKPALTVTTTSDDRLAVIAASGELDLATVAQVRSALAAEMGTGRSTVLDLTDVTFMDSTGVALLVRSMQAAKRADRDLRVVAAPGGAVERVLAMAGVLATVALAHQRAGLELVC